MTLDDVITTATAQLLATGRHAPLLVLDDGQQQIGLGLPPFPNDPSEKHQLMQLVGFSVARERKLGALTQVWLIAEGWLSSARDGKLPLVPPSQDPERKEVLLIYSQALPSQTSQAVALEIVRDPAGGVVRLKRCSVSDRSSDRGQIVSPLLEAFLRGYTVGQRLSQS